jgi:hypothetical protein
MPRLNRVDPWGDLHAVASRGLFTGNRGCIVDDRGNVVRHHNGSLWITCRTEYQDRKHPVAAPKTWTPLFFLDDAVALAAGHRPCGLCRRTDYLAFRSAVMASIGEDVMAPDLNRMIAAERHRSGRGLIRAHDRILWKNNIDTLPTGAVAIDPVTGEACLVTRKHLQHFTFNGWGPRTERPRDTEVGTLTPPTSIGALINGYAPRLHPTAADD